MTVSAAASHGEMKRHIAQAVGTDPQRYAAGTGTERHKRLTAAEVNQLADALEIGFIDGTKQEKRDAIMLKLGRDHRVGIRLWDSSDLRAVVDALEEGDDGE